MIENQVISVDGTDWLVHQATSIQCAISAINYARVRGTTEVKEIHIVDDCETIVAHVIKSAVTTSQ